MHSAKPARDPNLDLLRAAAVLAVVFYHLLQWSPVDPPWLDRLARFGAYGVDLFFVLSGFLIGSIYWREERDRGRVRLRRFLERRWLRTIPPYLAALLLAWGAVRLTRGTPFDWHYLLFVQNYGAQLPYFLVSWSLCVEEHFYLVVPLLMGLTRRFGRVRPLLLAIGVAGPLLFRWHDAPVGTSAAFGYYRTATHFHFEGLSLGLALAWLGAFRPAWWASGARAARWLIVPLLACCWLASGSSPAVDYVLTGSAVALLCAALLLATAGRRPIARGVLAKPVRAVAITSYSVYLTHPLMIHAGNLIAGRLHIGATATLLIVWPLAIAAFGYAFYFVFERGALALRDRLAPSAFGGGGLGRVGSIAEGPIADEIAHVTERAPEQHEGA